MTYEEAIYCITVMRNEVLDTWEFDFTTEQTDALRLAIEAMELRVAKKPRKETDATAVPNYYCINCGGVVGVGRVRNFKNCPHCGQRLEFGE